MAKGNIFDMTRKLTRRSGYAAEDQSGGRGGKRSEGRSHPASRRKKPKATSMAPREGGKRKHYGRPFGKEGGSS